MAVNQEDQLMSKQIKLMSVQVSDAEATAGDGAEPVEFLAKAKREPLQHVLDEQRRRFPSCA